METKLHTPSAGGVIIKNSKVLIIYSPLRNSYAFPKGTIDPGETKDLTAIREVKEETGYTVKIISFLGDFTFEFDHKNGVHYSKTVTYYLLQLADDAKPRPNLQPGEDFENVWVNINEAHDLLTFDDAKEVLHLAIEASRKL
jgi:8-oxo-dGTP pyrophosphatase MutT (NUDIX family)